MPTGNRIEKLNEVLKELLAQIVLREVELPRGVLATITRVETTRDLSQAKVFVSVFPENQTKPALAILVRCGYNLHQILNKKLRLRKVPKLRFLQDTQVIRELRLDELLDKVGDGQN